MNFINNAQRRDGYRDVVYNIHTKKAFSTAPGDTYHQLPLLFNNGKISALINDVGYITGANLSGALPPILKAGGYLNFTNIKAGHNIGVNHSPATGDVTISSSALNLTEMNNVLKGLQPNGNLPPGGAPPKVFISTDHLKEGSHIKISPPSASGDVMITSDSLGITEILNLLGGKNLATGIPTPGAPIYVTEGSPISSLTNDAHYLTPTTGVTKITGGNNVTISPPKGVGHVTINATGDITFADIRKFLAGNPINGVSLGTGNSPIITVKGVQHLLGGKNPDGSTNSALPAYIHTIKPGDNHLTVAHQTKDPGEVTLTATGFIEGIQVGANGSVQSTKIVTINKNDLGIDNLEQRLQDLTVVVGNKADLGPKITTAPGQQTQTLLTSQVPAIAVSDFLGDIPGIPQDPTKPVSPTNPLIADTTAMIALRGQVGDWCINNGIEYVITRKGGDGSNINDWTEIIKPTGLVLSVNGQKGSINLGPHDIGAAEISLEQEALKRGKVDGNHELRNTAGYITDPGVTRIIAGSSGNITINSTKTPLGTGDVTIDVPTPFLNDLQGVTITPANLPITSANQVLTYTGTGWENKFIADALGTKTNPQGVVVPAETKGLMWFGYIPSLADLP
jgi:hypothetical protein